MSVVICYFFTCFHKITLLSKVDLFFYFCKRAVFYRFFCRLRPTKKANFLIEIPQTMRTSLNFFCLKESWIFSLKFILLFHMNVSSVPEFYHSIATLVLDRKIIAQSHYIRTAIQFSNLRESESRLRMKIKKCINEKFGYI